MEIFSLRVYFKRSWGEKDFKDKNPGPTFDTKEVFWLVAVWTDGKLTTNRSRGGGKISKTTSSRNHFWRLLVGFWADVNLGPQDLPEDLTGGTRQEVREQLALNLGDEDWNGEHLLCSVFYLLYCISRPEPIMCLFLPRGTGWDRIPGWSWVENS
jgi:hypothetical protein